MNGMTRTTDSRLAKSGVSVGKLLPPKAAKIESPLDALQTTFSDMNRMRRSAAGRARPAAAINSLKWGVGVDFDWGPPIWANCPTFCCI
jgi:hypothetical protein